MKRKITIPLYWRCQVIGWSVAALYWGYIGATGSDFNYSLGVLYFISDVVIYILLTHTYRNFALKCGWHKLSLKPLVKRIVPAAIVLGVLFMVVTVVKVYVLRLWFNIGFTQSFAEFAKQNAVAIFIGGIRLMSIWLLAYHMYHYSQREINIARENARLAIITKDAQLSNLSAQLNPHFFFNSLNNIKALVIENPASARRAIDLMSDLLRTALYDKGVVLVPVKDEIGLVKDYLELEKLRFEERLQQSIEVDKAVGDTLILRFSIQTLVENAVKHGIAKQKNGGVIAVKVVEKDGFVKISVSNPGTLDNVASTNGLGLKNLEERLLLQFKNRAVFSIAEQPAGNVLATIIMPAA